MNKFFSLFLLAGLLVSWPVWSAVMTSTNYQIERDSINFGGGLSTSTSYFSESTFGQAGVGYSTSSNYGNQAGYQQLDTEAWLSLSVNSNLTLSPTINLALGGSALASGSFLVTTNNSAGYTLQLKAQASPALFSSSASFDDYSPSAGADYDWSLNNDESKFGFSPEGSDLVDLYKDDGSSCNVVAGSDTANKCWNGFSTSYQTIAQTAGPNSPAGSATVLKLRAEAGSANTLVNYPGSYSATIVVTAFTN